MTQSSFEVTRVLIVDDSSLFVEALASLLALDPGFEVQGVARSGEEAVALAQRLRPDNVITMDLHMPGMDGLAAVDRIMTSCATPILVLTGDASAPTARFAFDALSRGALNLMVKPALVADPRAGRALCERLHLLASVAVVHHPRRYADRPVSPSVPPRSTDRVVALVASTGGPPALLSVLQALPADFPLPILIVQHFPRGFVGQFAAWLHNDVALPVSLAVHGQPLEPAHVYVAPDELHMAVANGRIQLSRNLQGWPHCPSGDVLLQAVARNSPLGSIGVVLTGMGSDGAAGLLALREAGGFTIAQDGTTAVVDGMPREARRLGAAAEVLLLDAIPARLIELAPITVAPKRGIDA